MAKLEDQVGKSIGDGNMSISADEAGGLKLKVENTKVVEELSPRTITGTISAPTGNRIQCEMHGEVDEVSLGSDTMCSKCAYEMFQKFVDQHNAQS